MCEGYDDTINQFLHLLEDDIVSNPERLKPLEADFLRQAQLLTEGMVIDIDESLSKDDE